LQKKIIEAKKVEIMQFSTTEINKLEKKISSKLKKKYIELNDLINSSNEQNKENLKNEFIKAEASNYYIASKINELDKNYNQVFRNLRSALMKYDSLGDYENVDFFLKQISTTFDKYTTNGFDLDKESLKVLGEKFIVFRENENIDQEFLEQLIEKLS